MAVFGNSRKGFTITEIMIATLIMMLVVGGALAIYIMSQTAWHEGSVQIALQRRGSIAMERMVRGVRAAGEDKLNGIREAESVSIPDSSTIRFVSGIDHQERSFFLDVLDVNNNGVTDEILYDPNTDPLSPDDEDSIAENVNFLNFNQPEPRRVRIDLGLQRSVIGKPINVRITTGVTLRN